MLARNLLFIVVVLVAVGGLRASLFPQNTQTRKIHLDPGTTKEDDFQAVVRKVNEEFRKDWDANGLTPAPRASDLAVARRMSLALTGSVPSLEEIRQFEQHDKGERLDGWANHLLRDRRYSDYFADRLARAYVGTEDGPLLIYRKRRFNSWLSDQLHHNVPYGEMVRQMISARGLNTDQPAVNFIAAAYDDGKEKPDPEKLAIRVSRAFLGLRIDCAQCHDFKNPADYEQIIWKQTDFQSLAAFFGQTRHIVTHISDNADGEYKFEDRVHGGTHEIGVSVPFSPELMPEEGSRRERLAAWVTNPQNKAFSRATVNRVWAMMFGRPLLKRIESPTLTERGPAALDILAADFAAHNHDLQRLILLIASTEVFRLDSAAPFDITDAHDEHWAAFPLSRLRPEQVIGSVIQAASVRTIDKNSQLFVRATRFFGEKDFVTRYGDADDDDFAKAHGTIPQRLLMMNGDLVDGKAKNELLNASTQIAIFAPDDNAAVETAYLCVLTRKPTPKELEHFVAKIAGTHGDDRRNKLADMYWVLFNSTEMSFNH
ncbi:MAG: DUF1549 and DUF1553 domain-containing protein [Planctomycetes bacterium]|nr:DUF1549 and DUF1553 domain-containing protein [Planctomycetota bacterium]